MVAGETRLQILVESCQEVDRTVEDLPALPWSVIDTRLNSAQLLVLYWELVYWNKEASERRVVTQFSVAVDRDVCREMTAKVVLAVPVLREELDVAGIHSRAAGRALHRLAFPSHIHSALDGQVVARAARCQALIAM